MKFIFILLFTTIISNWIQENDGKVLALEGENCVDDHSCAVGVCRDGWGGTANSPKMCQIECGIHDDCQTDEKMKEFLSLSENKTKIGYVNIRYSIYSTSM